MKVIINGHTCEAQPGQTVLQAAKENGLYIPSLCYHPKTGPAGKCRVCIVKVEGNPGLQTSCNLPVKDGMKVTIDSEEIRAHQKLIVDLLLSSGKHDCLSCEKNGNCELQDAAYYLGIERPSFDLSPAELDQDESSEMVFVDRSKCIQCGRCLEGCNSTVVNEVINFSERGFTTRIAFDDNLPLGESSCVQCGECVQLCPVGALLDKNALGKGRAWEFEKVTTVCPYCGVGCQLVLHIDRKRNKIVRVTGVEDAHVNLGMLCIKGRYGFDFVADDGRLTTPWIKDITGKFQEATWEEAITLIANKFNELKKNHGPDSLAGLASAKVTNEENYVFQKFMRREIGTNNVDHCARLCHSSTVAGLAASFGSGAMTNDIADIRKADVILVTGSDTTAAHPVISARIKKAVRDGKTKLIVIDPKKIRLADYAEIYAAQRPGTDVAVLNGIMQIIIKNGWQDKKYITDRCEEFASFKEEVLQEKYSPQNVEKLSGIPAQTLHDIAEMFAKAKTGSVFYSMGITQHTTGTDNVKTVANLQMLCGNLGIPGGGVNPLRGQCNVQGACDMGGLPNVYPGYQKVNDPAAKEKFEKIYGRPLSDKIGLTVTDVVDSAHKGELKGLYIMGENPFLSDPDQHHVIEALKKIDFLVVQDIFMTETAEFAHVVLPAKSFAEKTGHFTNTERRVQRINVAVKAPGQAKEDWEIIQMIALAMGSDWNYQKVEDITAEINLTTPSYTGITWDRIGQNGLQWPCPTTEHPGTPYLHKDRFARGLGLFHAIEFKEPAELPDEEYPLIMTTGRVLEQFHTGTMSRKSKGINNIAQPMVMISVEDAEALDIANSEMIKVSTRRGEIETKAFVTKKILKGVIYIPFHYAEAPANRLTINAVDPVAKIPEYKVCAAKVSKIKSK
jgi:formate dehydrogenase major subunit